MISSTIREDANTHQKVARIATDFLDCEGFGGLVDAPRRG